MALSSDAFIERSRLKQQLSFWRLFTIAALVIFAVLLIEKNSTDPASGASGESSSEHIARVTIAGTIMDNKQLYETLRSVRDDNSAKAMILYVDTPGGAAAAGEQIFRYVKSISAKKPVVISMRGFCASAGYMIALAGDHVLALPSTLTGSIGVILQTAEFSELADKAGINPVVVKSGEFKDILSYYKRPRDEEIAIVQSVVNDFHDVFVEMIADNRDLSIEEVRAIADGRIFSARQALDLKLIDALGSEEEAVAWLQENHSIDSSLEVKDIESKTKFEKFMDRLSEVSSFQALLPSQPVPGNGLMLEWQPNFTIN